MLDWEISSEPTKITLFLDILTQLCHRECGTIAQAHGLLCSVVLLLRACLLLPGVCRTAVEWHCAMQISPGGQGFRSDLPNSTWYNNGLTGEDYVGLMSIPEIAFGTVHFCEALTPPEVLAVLRRPAPPCMTTPEIADPVCGGCNMRMQCKPQVAAVTLSRSVAAGAFPPRFMAKLMQALTSLMCLQIRPTGASPAAWCRRSGTTFWRTGRWLPRLWASLGCWRRPAAT